MARRPVRDRGVDARGEVPPQLNLAKLARYGFWSMASEARTDWSMLMGSLFLLIVGAGASSLDAVLARGRVRARPPSPVKAEAS